MMDVAPLLPAAAGLIVGIVSDRLVAPAISMCVCVLGFATLASLSRRIRAVAGSWIVLIGAVAVGAALHSYAARTVEPSSVERYATVSGGAARLIGTIISTPRLTTPRPHPFSRWARGGERTSFLLHVESIESDRKQITATGRVRVTVYEAVLDLRDNDRVEIFGRLYALQPLRNPGSFDWQAFNRRQGVVARLSCKHRESVRVLGGDAAATVGRFRSWLRSTASRLLTHDLSAGGEDQTSLLDAMVLGQRSGLSHRLNDIFVRAGCIHFLAVSGVHLAIVMLLCRLVCRVFTTSAGTATWVMMVAVVLYLLLAEPRAPILRASVLAMFYCVARLIGRQRSYLNWIAGAAIVLLVPWPLMVFDVGFQLSFAAVLGVAFLAPALRRAFRCAVHSVRGPSYSQGDGIAPWPGSFDRRGLTRPPGALRRGSKWLSRNIGWGLAIGLGAWLAGLPIVAVYFQQMHPWSAINSVLLMPFVTVVMGLAFATILLGLMSQTLASAVSVVLNGAEDVLSALVERMAEVPGATFATAPPPWWLVAGYFLVLIAFARRFRRTTATRREEPAPPSRGLASEQADVGRSSNWALLATGGLFVACMLFWIRPAASTDRLVISVLSVGRGTAIVIELPSGDTMLYDAGTSYASDLGRSIVVPFLRSRGISRIKKIFVSHPNLDHLNAIATIVDEVPTGSVVLNGFFEMRSPIRSPARHLLDLLDRRGQLVETLPSAPAKWEEGGVSFELLSPFVDSTEVPSANNSSTVMRLTYAGHSVLLTGDIEDAAQRALIRRGDLTADVLLLPHHGGVRSSTAEFLRAVHASVVIRSTSERTDQTFNGLPELVGSTPMLSTADIGAIGLVFDGTGFHVAPLLPTSN